MNKGLLGKVSLYSLSLLAIIMILVFYVIPSFAVAFGATVNPNFMSGGSTNQFLRFNIAKQGADNITEVNITLPSGFTFVANSNTTTASDTLFSNNATTVSWVNATEMGFIPIGSHNFTINVSVPNAANGTLYNFTVYTLDINGIANQTPVTVEVLDVTSPSWSANQSSTPGAYSPSTPSRFNVTWNDNVDISVVFITIRNSTGVLVNNASMTNATYGDGIYNYSVILPADTFNWTSYANDTTGNWNSTDTWSFTISKSSPSCNLILSKASPQFYGTPFVPTCTCTNPEGMAKLYRNSLPMTTSSDVTLTENGTSVVLPVGNWQYVCNITATQNYNSASNTSGFNVSKVAPSFIVQLTTPAAKGTPSDYTALDNNSGDGGCNYTLLRNNTFKGNESSVFDDTVLPKGAWNYTYFTTGCANYTAGRDERMLYVLEETDIGVNPCPGQTFCLADAFNSSGNETVVACAGTSLNVSWFNFWYNGQGPFNDTNGGIVNKQYYALKTFSSTGAYSNEGLSNSSTPPCVAFTLNDSAPFTNQTIEINATVYNKTDYSQAASECNPPGSPNCNGTMFTINYAYVEARDAIGNNLLPNVIFGAFNNNTNTKRYTYSEPAMTDNYGYWAEHCIGLVNLSGCFPVVPGEPVACAFHGGPLGDGTNCPINSTTNVYAIDVISSNSTQQNINIGVNMLNLSTISSMSMIMASSWNPDIMNGDQMTTIFPQIKVYDNTTDQLAFVLSTDKEGLPAILQPYRHYKINFTYEFRNFSYSFMTPVSGMTGAQIFIANTTVFVPDVDYRTVIGKVVNETKNANGVNYPVANATVYAQFFKGPSGAFGIQFFNSSTTDQYGVFTMKIPKTRSNFQNGNTFLFPQYQFYIVSDKTNDGVPIYFTTIDNNGNRGYFAMGDTIVLPPLTLKAGGQVDVGITLNNASTVISELNKFSILGTGVTRDAVTGKFTMISMFETMSIPATINMSLLSPVGNNLIVDMFGKNNSMGDPMSGSIIRACFNTSVNVTQGNRTFITCNLTEPGYLNVTVWTCQNIFNVFNGDTSGCNMNNKAGRNDFWFEANGIIRNSDDQVVVFINSEGVLLENLARYGSDDVALRIPLPPGDYTLELTSPFDHSRYLNVFNKTAFTITAESTSFLNLTRGESWNLQSMFNPSMSLSDNNQLNVSVMTQQGSPLNNTSIVLTGKIMFLNRSNASSTPITFAFDSSRQTFYNTSFKPSDFGLSAGKYLILFNASNITSSVLYTTTDTFPINAFDFQVGVDLGGFTFGMGQTISGRIFAYNTSGTQQNPVGLNASSGNVTVNVYDETGADVTSVAISVSNITNGQGYINMTLPNSLGFYEIVTSVKTNGCVATDCVDNKVGVSDNWIQISNLNIKTSTDRQTYQTSDNVVLAVQVSNSSNSVPISGVSIEVVADSSSTPAMGTTGNDGKAVITLNASTHSGSTSWSYGWHNLRIKISKNIGNDVVKLETWYGFDVRGLDLFLRPGRPSYSVLDNVTISVYGPLEEFTITSVKADSTTLTQGPLNDCEPTANVTFCIDDAWSTSSKNVKIGNWSMGHHNVEITISSGSNQQKVYTGFDVSNYNIIVSTDNFVYDLNQNITLNIKASYINGTALSNVPVAAVLFKAQPPNDIYVNMSNGTTDSSGQATLKIRAAQPGFNYIIINVSNQLQHIGVQVSSLKVNLLSTSPDNPGVTTVTNYNAIAGNNVTIYINATSGGVKVSDNSTVTARLWSFGNSIDLPSNTTANGNATITFQVSSSSPAQMYGLEVRITTPNGDQGFAPPSSLTVSGGSALRLSVSADRPFSNPYKVGDTAMLRASLTYPNGTGISGYNVTFEIGSEGSAPRTIGTSVTGTGGDTTKSFNITSNYTDGRYFVHAYLTDNTEVQSYNGFLISSLKVDVRTNNDTYSPGQTIVLNITVLNRTGYQINATGISTTIFNKDRGEISNYYTPSGSQPYQISIPISNGSNSIGAYPIAVTAFVNQSQGTGFTMINVKNISETVDMTLPGTITPGEPFVANITSTSLGPTNTTTLRVFSPTASSLIYENASMAIGGSGPIYWITTSNITIPNPGVYVFVASVDRVGSVTKVITVNQTSGTIPEVWTHTSASTSSSTNTKSFTTSNDVYIMSNIANTTANVLTVDTETNTTISYSLPLKLNSSSAYYGTLNSTDLASGRKYFVRLDTSASTGIANTMFMVS